MPSAIRPLHLAVALDGPARFDAGHYAALAALAERGALDFVTLGDPLTRPGPDALSVLAHVAPLTRRIGLVPTVAVTHAEPYAVSAAVATLDWVSQGRAGWTVGTSASGAEARLFGRGPAPAGTVWREAGEIIDTVTRLWDGPAADAGPANAVPGTERPVGAGTGRHSGRPEPYGQPGPPGRPAVFRPPQRRPPVVVDLGGAGEPGRRVAARHADVVLIRAGTPEEAEQRRRVLLTEAAALGRDPAALRVLLSLSVDLGEGEPCPQPGLAPSRQRRVRAAHFSGGPVELAELIARWHRDGVVDGFHLAPLLPHRDLERIVNGTVALLQHRSLFRAFHPGGTLREHLGLTRSAGFRTAAAPAPAAAGRAR